MPIANEWVYTGGLNKHHFCRDLVIWSVADGIKVIINGNLEDDAWLNAEIAKDFVMFRPGTGENEPENQKTEVKVIYDDEAIYFGAMLYDDNVIYYCSDN